MHDECPHRNTLRRKCAICSAEDDDAEIARLRRERDEARERLFDNGHNHDATSCSLGSLCPWCAVYRAERERDEALALLVCDECAVEISVPHPEEEAPSVMCLGCAQAVKRERDALAARVAALEVCLRRSDAMIDAAVHEVIGDDDAARKFRHDLRQTMAENHRALSPAPAEPEQP